MFFHCSFHINNPSSVFSKLVITEIASPTVTGEISAPEFKVFAQLRENGNLERESFQVLVLWLVFKGEGKKLGNSVTALHAPYGAERTYLLHLYLENTSIQMLQHNY